MILSCRSTFANALLDSRKRGPAAMLFVACLHGEEAVAIISLMKREFSAGGLVRKGELWLIRRPTPNPEYRGNLGWSFPKGWIESGENVEQAALREVREEGGVIVKIVKKLSTIKLFFTDQNGEKVMKFVTYFLMDYVEDAPEGHDSETAEVKWVNKEEALVLLAFKNDKKLLEEASSL
jgi:8-oxo-dGTP pyrophosphatase MutT (NUDIX family)